MPASPVPTAAPRSVPPAPAPPAGRLALVDAVRGVAMLGIMLVNFPTMNTMAGDETSAYGGVQTAADRWVAGLNLALLNGKCYPIFALLFGLGLFLSHQAGRSRSVAARRLALLLAIGLLHLALVWWGDILVVYAALGLLALPCLRWPPRRLLLVAAVLLVLLPALSPLLPLLDRLGLLAADRPLLHGLRLSLPSPEAAAATYAGGTFAAMLRQRGLDYLSDFTPFAAGEVTPGLLLAYAKYYGQLYGLFLLGLWAGRQGLHLRLEQDRGWTWRAFRSAAPLAAVLTGLRYGVPGLDAPLSYPQGTALALAYLLGLGLLLPRWPWARRTCQAVGRLSLTAYLAHTTLCSLLLYATGLGLYGSIGPAALLPISLGAYALIAWGCAWWIRRFRVGPAEWAWRSALHGRVLPLR